jgi:hypothetical protein
MSTLAERWLSRSRSAKPAKAANANAEVDQLSQLSQVSQLALRRAIVTSLDLRILLGLDPPPQSVATCRSCGGAATSIHPLLHYLDGHADHGGFCPPRRRKDHRVTDQPRMVRPCHLGKRNHAWRWT